VGHGRESASKWLYGRVNPEPDVSDSVNPGSTTQVPHFSSAVTPVLTSFRPLCLQPYSAPVHDVYGIAFECIEKERFL
jgi:hypothetical protein